MALERLWSILFIICNSINNNITTSIFGDIHSYCIVGQTYETYQLNKINNAITNPIVKVWSGR